MKEDDLPAEDNVVRYVRPRLVLDDGSIEGSAFKLRPNDEGLSVNWLECFEGAKKDQVVAARRRIRLSMSPNGRLAELNVGYVTQQVCREQIALRFVHAPLDATEQHEADPSHSLILGLPPEHEEEADLIADMIAECVSVVHHTTDQD